MRGATWTIARLEPFRSSCPVTSRQHIGAPDAIPVVGGVIDLAIGAKQSIVMMQHFTTSGESKIAPRHTCPLEKAARRQVGSNVLPNSTSPFPLPHFARVLCGY